MNFTTESLNVTTTSAWVQCVFIDDGACHHDENAYKSQKSGRRIRRPVEKNL
jgi:hypothetical protein